MSREFIFQVCEIGMDGGMGGLGRNRGGGTWDGQKEERRFSLQTTMMSSFLTLHRSTRSEILSSVFVSLCGWLWLRILWEWGAIQILVIMTRK